MKVLVTGSEGYIGSQLAPRLVSLGYLVEGIDTGFFKEGNLYGPEAAYNSTMLKDIRNITSDDLSGFDAVIHLAELSNDPLGEMNPQITCQINHLGSVELAKKSRDAGVTRFIYFSSCSVYGIGGADTRKTEESETNPQTTYAHCKVLSENDIADLADENFSPTFMRNATVYGPSNRMRFDIVVNNLTGMAWTEGKINLRSDGSPWRPLVHIDDIISAVELILSAPRKKIHNQILNTGFSSENYQIREVAEIIQEVFPDCRISMGGTGHDNRSYRVSFNKIQELFPDFSPNWNLRKGVVQLRRLYEEIGLTKGIFTAPPYTRLKQLKKLIADGKLNNHLYWK
jgi:nucleoside-diphosphate-sugar epimerase